MEASFVFAEEHLLEFLDNMFSGSFQASYFLHGICGIFALALHDRFGYDLCVVLDDEWNYNPAAWKSHIVHIYCTKNKHIFIDIRGFIENDDDSDAALYRFLEEFEDFIDFDVEPNVLNLQREDLEQMIEECMDDKEYSEAMKAANEFIAFDPARYTV